MSSPENEKMSVSGGSPDKLFMLGGRRELNLKILSYKLSSKIHVLSSSTSVGTIWYSGHEQCNVHLRARVLAGLVKSKKEWRKLSERKWFKGYPSRSSNEWSIQNEDLSNVTTNPI